MMISHANVQRVIEYMKEHETAYPSDISEALEIGYDEVGEIIKHLMHADVVEFTGMTKGEEVVCVLKKGEGKMEDWKDEMYKTLTVVSKQIGYIRKEIQELKDSIQELKEGGLEIGWKA